MSKVLEGLPDALIQLQTVHTIDVDGETKEQAVGTVIDLSIGGTVVFRTINLGGIANDDAVEQTPLLMRLVRNALQQLGFSPPAGSSENETPT